MDSIVCYICNEKANEWRRNLNGLKSRHSGVSVRVLVHKILSNFQTQRNIDDESNCACGNCLEKIEEYDWACIVAKRYEKELRKILLKTETFHDDQHNFNKIEEVNVQIDGVNEYQKDFGCSSVPRKITENDSVIKGEARDDETSNSDYNFEMNVTNYGENSSDSDGDFLCSDHERKSTQKSVRSVENNVLYCCDNCGESLSTKKKLLAHMRWHQEKQITQFKCQKCFVVLSDQNTFDDHVKLHENKLPTECVICGKVLSKKSNLHAHMKIHDRKSWSNSNEENMQEDEKTTEQASCFKCDECGEFMSTKMKFLAHERWHREQRSPDFKCRKCFMILDDQVSYDKHLKLHEERAPLECVFCGKFLSKKSNLHIHMRIHTSNNLNENSRKENKINRESRLKDLYECNECDETFSRKKDLKIHRRWHNQQKIPEFKCQKCFFVLESKELFDDHMKLHEGRSPLECVFCEKKLSKKSNLHSHMKIHANTRNHQCQLCGKSFIHHTSFDIHMKFHMNDRAIACEHCPLRFVSKSNLKRHLLSHSKEKPFACSICGNKFRYISNMHAHEKTHIESDKKHVCSFCSASFPRISKLNQHMEKNHSTIPMTDSSIENNIETKDIKSEISCWLSFK